jgi:hypothetical protein
LSIDASSLDALQLDDEVLINEMGINDFVRKISEILSNIPGVEIPPALKNSIKQIGSASQETTGQVTQLTGAITKLSNTATKPVPSTGL